MSEEKFIDESWKQTADKEKQILGADGQPLGSSPEKSQPQDTDAQEQQALELNFVGYMTSLAFQAMVFLGEVPNPATNLVEKNLEQAKLLIDTLALLREKTKGNLNKQEQDTINAYIYELQMKFVEVLEKEVKGDR